MKSGLSILDKEPFSLFQKEKEVLFFAEMKKAIAWHYENCPEFKKVCDNRIDVRGKFEIEDVPYLPASIFKNFDLLSVPMDKIVKTLYSSSTSGKPSKILVDKITSDNQVLALSKILADFLGKDRRYFIIFDSEKTIKSVDGELSSRGTAIRGMMPLAKKVFFVLDDDLNLDLGKINLALSEIKTSAKEKVCFFGFSWLLYNVYLKNNKNGEFTTALKKLFNKANIVLHIGGWKKLKDINISKDNFNNDLAKMFLTDKSKVVDVYGMTEQLGVIYPDCEYGYKHAPLYSEIITRDINTLKPSQIGETGFIQLLSPLPHSYPGISVLSEDIGKVVGVDDCRCGRKGKYFVFEKRSEKAELKGCGDVLNI